MNLGEALAKTIWGFIVGAIGVTLLGKGYNMVGRVQGTLETYADLSENKDGKLEDLANEAGYRLVEK